MIYLITAPPGWGKTYKTLKMIKNSSRKWLYVSPLRALANEFLITANESAICSISLRYQNLDSAFSFLISSYA